MNAPTGNTLAATELTMGIMLAAARKIPLANDSLKAGKWDRKKFMGVELYNKTLGVVGLGRIGTNVAIRAKSFGMKIVAYDPYIKKSKADSLGVMLYDKLEDVLRAGGFSHLPYPVDCRDKEHDNGKEMALMKDDVILVNCARGGIVNENDLYDALKSGKVFAAGVDVFEKEPVGSNKLLELENVLATPHIGANTKEGQEAVAVIIAEQVYNALHGKPYQNAVNIPFMKSQFPAELQRYFDLAEKMGKLAAQLTKGRTGDQVRHGRQDVRRRPLRTEVRCSLQLPAVHHCGAQGFSRVSCQETVTFINAPYFVKDRNIAVEESKTDQFDKFNDLILIHVITDEGETKIAGTVFSDGAGRIVLYDNFRLDIIPEGTFLHFRIFDRPGIIGKVATILGDKDINIAGFGLARQVSGEEIAFVSVDSPIDKMCLLKYRQSTG